MLNSPSLVTLRFLSPLCSKYPSLFTLRCLSTLYGKCSSPFPLRCLPPPPQMCGKLGIRDVIKDVGDDPQARRRQNHNMVE